MNISIFPLGDLSQSKRGGNLPKSAFSLTTQALFELMGREVYKVDVSGFSPVAANLSRTLIARFQLNLQNKQGFSDSYLSHPSGLYS